MLGDGTRLLTPGRVHMTDLDRVYSDKTEPNGGGHKTKLQAMFKYRFVTS